MSVYVLHRKECAVSTVFVLFKLNGCVGADHGDGDGVAVHVTEPFFCI